MRMVAARSCALIPVVTPFAASTDTVKSVRYISRFCTTMSQADRFSGNIHSEKIYIWLEDGVLKKEPKKSNASKAAEQLKNIPPGAVLVNRMRRKDLMDPTMKLNQWRENLPRSQG